MKTRTFDRYFWISLLFFTSIIVFICFFPSWFVQDGYPDFRNTGQIGDTIGGIMGPFVAIAASLLTFFAFWVQFKANMQQRNDIALERFEFNLYEMINVQESITNNLVWETLDDSEPLGIKNYEEKVLMRQKGRDVFQVLYEFYPFSVRKVGTHKDVLETVDFQGYRDLFAREESAFDVYVNDQTLGMLDHYFRHLYCIFKYIKESKVIDVTKKYQYASIVRSSLSQYELVMLFYNCLSPNGIEKFKPLVEDFALLKNLRISLLAKDEERTLYAPKYNVNYVDLPNLPLTEYAAGAFRHIDRN